MNSVTKGIEIPDSDDMIIKLKTLHQHEGTRYWIVIKSSNKPLVTIPHQGTKMHACWQVLDEDKKELRHSLYQSKISVKDVEQLMEDIKSNFKDAING